MGFKVSFESRMSEEVIIRSQIQACIFTPFNILLFPTIGFPVVSKGQYKPDFVLLCFAHDEIQSLKCEKASTFLADDEWLINQTEIAVIGN